MHTGYYFGFFLAALANYFVGAKLRLALDVRGRRHACAARHLHPLRRPRVGDVAARVAEPAPAADDRRRSRRSSRPSTRDGRCSTRCILLVSIVGLWAGSVYVPTSVRADRAARRATARRRDAARVVRHDGAVGRARFSAASCCRRSPNRSAAGSTLGLYFVGDVLLASRSGSATSSICRNALAPFFAVLFFLGVGGANFAMYTLWLPEQYSTECRAQRVRVRDVGRPVRRRRDHVPRRRRRRAFPHHRHAGRADVDRVPDRPAAAAVRRGNARPGSSRAESTLRASARGESTSP